jgi:hypothetical protein
MGLPGCPGVKMRLKERNFSALSGGRADSGFLAFLSFWVFCLFLNLRR